MKRGKECGVHVHQANVPQEDHHIRPLSRGGPNVKDNRIRICANGHSDAHYVMDLCEDYKGYENIPRAILRSFGYRVRRLGKRGWDSYKDVWLRPVGPPAEWTLTTTMGDPRL